MYLCISLNISVLQHGWIILCTVLDTAAGVWLDRNGLVTSSQSNNNGQMEDESLELMRRCRHATSSVGSRLYVYGGLRGGNSNSKSTLYKMEPWRPTPTYLIVLSDYNNYL